MSISKRLKELREQKGLSVADLADAAGVSRPYIWQIESGRRGNPSADKIQKIATALGVTIADLLGLERGLPEATLKKLPASLKAFLKGRGKALGVQAEDVEMLKGIHFRGRRPKTPEDWELIFSFLKRILG